ncbi:hypothetical protein BC351_10320 [Paenibacillus ferrarius]|uniref:F5/8 type C domain-containing protein n=1 Tax=Paenibacillus ferrarius TaxID=1469647 RepID=A0A1V4H8U2_9BACL|nr:hypothetical protein [Paenibacillus ferrarius]OPH47578.1 hypothetical protein BC351_10320 [Paenibacillus ferrarius]
MSIYYVDGINGLDSKNGTSLALAFKTLDKAFASIGAGDEIRLVPNSVYKYTSTVFTSGIYKLSSTIDRTYATIDLETKSASFTQNKSFYCIELKNVGALNTSGGTILNTFDTCIIDGGTNSANASFWTNSNKVILKRCIIKNLYKNMGSAMSVQLNYGTTTVSEISNCVFFNLLGVTGSGTYLVFKNCIFDTATPINASFSMVDSVKRSTYVEYEYVNNTLYGVYLYYNKFLISLEGGEVCSMNFADPNLNTIPAMTSTTLPNGVVASSSIVAANYDWQAFDRLTTGNGWLTGLANQWISYQFVTPKIIAKYTLIVNYHFSAAPKDWTFQGSNDGIVWISLDTRTNVIDWVVGTKKVFSFSNSSAYSRYRVYISNNNGHSSYTNISEIEMMETYFDFISLGTKTPSDNDFINRGVDKTTVFDLTKNLSKKISLISNNTALGSGKVLKQSIDTSQIKIKKVTIT